MNSACRQLLVAVLADLPQLQCTYTVNIAGKTKSSAVKRFVQLRHNRDPAMKNAVVREALLGHPT